MRHNHRGNDFSERAFSALAESLPEIKNLQRFDLSWCSGLPDHAFAIGRITHDTSLFRFHVDYCAPFFGPTNN
jgi:hypothetical protein